MRGFLLSGRSRVFLFETLSLPILLPRATPSIRYPSSPPPLPLCVPKAQKVTTMLPTEPCPALPCPTQRLSSLCLFPPRQVSLVSKTGRVRKTSTAGPHTRQARTSSWLRQVKCLRVMSKVVNTYSLARCLAFRRAGKIKEKFKGGRGGDKS
ncbi:hypothetical protein GGS23DRAFT_44182 [Durotheca rogersii]|uniref:uncharacterized protein n=1 Tax=Durotheca rogersii TaxID=419775 RepID=UPI0022211918|nr:uncharacterized protein GGS23DRAFT_44182 [Durotheca rogersii]KAI5868674.1 hypothetical protein GGS23DRAFT_44182 [Durotheca rogersii]